MRIQAGLPGGSDGDEAGVDPGGFGQGAQVAGTGGEGVIAVGGQARHGGINRIAAAPRASSIPARPPWAIMTATTRFAGQPPRPAAGTGA